MKKPLSIIALLMALMLLATACQPSEPAAEEPTSTPSPSPSPTVIAWTPEPTITPRPMSNVEPLEEGERALLIDPINTPTLTPLNYTYVSKTSDAMGISYEVPSSWVEEVVPDNNRAVVYTEPYDEMHQVPATLTIAMSEYSSNQTTADADTEIDRQIQQLREQYPDGFEVTSKATRNAMGQEGRYVTYWLEVLPEGAEDMLRMRGRCFVIPIGSNLYMIRTLHPANWNSEYDDKVFRHVVSTMKVL